MPTRRSKSKIRLKPECDVIRAKYEVLRGSLDERMSRLWAGAEAVMLGQGGLACVAAATTLSRTTVRDGLRDIQAIQSGAQPKEGAGRVRRPGGGRNALSVTDRGIVDDLEKLVEPVTRGDPRSPLQWTCKSTRVLAEELGHRGHRVSYKTVAHLLSELGYSLQANRKTLEGTKQHPDRNAQFEYINRQIKRFHVRGQPVISVDSKKKELVGQFRNGGREWRPGQSPEKVKVHDFIDRKEGKAIPYGVYDLAENKGWVNVGKDHDTPAFAVASIRGWWRSMGRRVYPSASDLLITADAGGSNGYRARAWKVELQRLADDTGLRIWVCHLPPGTSKWNKIEHRMFCHITQNWRGRPLISYETIVNLIGGTRTSKGLTVKARIDEHAYPLKVKVSQEELNNLWIEPSKFHGEWNYAILPRTL